MAEGRLVNDVLVSCLCFPGKVPEALGDLKVLRHHLEVQSRIKGAAIPEDPLGPERVVCLRLQEQRLDGRVGLCEGMIHGQDNEAEEGSLRLRLREACNQPAVSNTGRV